MRRHILGIALFTLIVSLSAAIFAFLRAPNVPPITAVEQPDFETAASEHRRETAAAIDSRLHSVVVDLASRRITAKFDLTWQGTGEPPARVLVRVGLVTEAAPFDGRVISFELLKNVFANGRHTSENTMVASSEYQLASFDPKENYYAYIEASDYTKPAGPIKLVVIEKNRMAGAVPVLVKHKK